MFFFYQFLIFLILISSPLIFLIRILKNKEHKKRFLEKLCLIREKKISGKLVWFHASSVGELMSIVPLIYELEKNQSIKMILITTSTLSSSKIFSKFKFKKTIHQFYPVDFYFINLKFLNYWKPSIAIFVESEIWPSMFKLINQKGIKLILLNARITKKTFKKWNILQNFSKDVFSNISIAYPQNLETVSYLKKLNVRNIKKIGNLKFTETEQNKKNLKVSLKIKNKLKKRVVLCASSTHANEEILIANAHKKLKQKIKNFITIIIPRHIERTIKIEKEIKELGLKTTIRSSNKNIENDTDIYLIDTYGETKKFFQLSNICFIGGSFVNHGGQNPIEPARFGLNIIHGPFIENFKDVYDLFKKKNIAFKINKAKQLATLIEKLLNKKNKRKFDLNDLGEKILKKTLININNEINKT